MTNTNPFLDRTAAELRAQATAATAVPGHHIIDGDHRTGGGTRTLVYPGDGLASGEMAVGGSAEIDSAVASASRAFASGVWARVSPKERGSVLSAFADLIDEHRDELALLETLDMGKPVADAWQLDVPKSANMVRWYAHAVDKQYDHIAPTSPSALALVRRVPLGVVACITPWNFPLYQAAYKLGPVLATGNSLVIKPSEYAPRSTLRVADLALQAGLPPGVLNVVAGDGATGAALSAHPLVNAVAFTGSPATGVAVSQAAGAHLAKVSIESGGKSAHVVLGDAKDLDVVAAAVADGFCYNQGQVCSAGTRLIVPEDLADELIEKVIGAVERYRPGDPFDAATRLGAVVSARHLRGITDKVAQATRDGATLRYQGDTAGMPAGGAWAAPTIFDHVQPGSALAQQEVFGPVLAVLRYDGDPSQAICLANDTQYGLGAALWTRDVDAALALSQHLRAGQIWVNNYDGADLTVPWGGFGKSGLGRDKSLEALAEYTASCTTWIALDDPHTRHLDGGTAA